MEDFPALNPSIHPGANVRTRLVYGCTKHSAGMEIGDREVCGFIQAYI